MRGIVFAIVVVAGMTSSLPVMAHEGAGRLEIVAADPVASNSLRYRVRLVYVADGHPVPDATVTAVGEGPGGQATVPVALAATADEGVYEGRVTLPASGRWSVRFTSVTPPATAAREESAEVPTTTSAPSTASPTTGERPASDSRDSGYDAAALPFLLVAGGLLAIGAVLMDRRRRRREDR